MLSRLQSVEKTIEHLRWITVILAVAVVMAIAVIGVVGLSSHNAAANLEEGTPAYSATIVRVTGTPEEVVLDFGVNAKPWAADAREFRFSHTVLMDMYTAKDFSVALEKTIEAHEAKYGTIQRKK